MRDYARLGRKEAVRTRPSSAGARAPVRGPCCLLVLLLIFAAMLPALAVAGYEVLYADRIFPGVTVLGVAMGGLQRAQAESLLSQQFTKSYREGITLRFGERTWPVTRDEVGLRYDAAGTVALALAVGRGASWPDRLQEQFRVRQEGRVITPTVDMDQVARLGYLNRLAKEIDRSAVSATIRVEGTKVSAVAAQHGQRLNVEATAKRLGEALLAGESRPVDLVVDDLAPAVEEDGVREAVATATAILASPLVLTFSDHTWVFEGGKVSERVTERTWPMDPQRLAAMLSLRQRAGTDGRVRLLAALDEDLVSGFLTSIAPQIAQPARDARLEMDAKTGQIVPTMPSQEGRALVTADAVKLIVATAATAQRRVALPVQVTRPKVAMEEIAKMGLVEMVSQGSSIFKPSTAERAYNIQLAASRINGAVIAPGELFSFNAALGPVTAESGYRQSWSIIGDYTVSDVGGGVCQVATTFFRAVYSGGYTIEERAAHAYLIPRYEQGGYSKGMDATVYDPGTDFKFRNDGPSYLLVQTNMDQTSGTLTVTFFGTKPGWTVTTQGPVLENVVAHDPKPIYVNDPTLPQGPPILVQSAMDGVTVTITRIVKKGDQVLRTYVFKWPYRATQEEWIVGTKK
jgi:vancomycin resistance protein YoaR